MAPEDFLGATAAGDGRDVWIPFSMMSAAVSPTRESPFTSPRAAGHYHIDYIGRLAPDATLEGAHAEADVFGGSLSSRRPDPRARYGARVRRFAMRDWTSFTVSLRQPEIGVRMALGAEPAAVLRLVMRQAMRLALWGSAIGGAIALIAGAIVNANLQGTPSVEPLMFIGSASVLLLALLAAAFIPARRAARVDPIVVLRQE